MTLTELYDELATTINKAELPFDAKVFVVRSIHTEMEQKYQDVIHMLKAQKNAQKDSQKEQTQE